MLCGLRVNSSPLYAQAISILKIFLNKPLSQFFYGGILFICPLNHLIIYIRKVLDIGYLISLIFQIPPKGIKDDKGPSITNMEIIIYRWPAAIHSNFIFMYRNKILFFSG